MAKDKNVLDGTYDLSRQNNLYRSDGEEIPNELAKKLSTFADNFNESDEYDQEKESYSGSIGNLFADK